MPEHPGFLAFFRPHLGVLSGQPVLSLPLGDLLAKSQMRQQATQHQLIQPYSGSFVAAVLYGAFLVSVKLSDFVFLDLPSSYPLIIEV